MFDIGFSEMMVIAVVALIVIGPERLPKVARTLGHLVGRMQRYVSDVKADINREMEVEELRKFKEQFQDAAQSVEQTIHGGLTEAQSEMNKIESAAVPAAEAKGQLEGPADSTAGIAGHARDASS
jgi:sec-independent protein translocase protein TatB